MKVTYKMIDRQLSFKGFLFNTLAVLNKVVVCAPITSVSKISGEFPVKCRMESVSG